MRKRSSARRRGGSVLMETLLVLPILLLIFGGLFIMGDLAHARLHLGAIDRAAAWSADNRFSEPKFREWFAFVPKTSSLRPERVKSGHPGSAALGRGAESEENAGLDMPRGNHWLGFYAGYAHAKAAMPFWVRLANAHSSLYGGPEEERFADESRLFVYASDDPATGRAAGDYREFGRAFAVHRKPVDEGTGTWSRAAPADKLAWQAIAGDRWCGTDASSGLAASAPGVSFRRHPVALFLGE